MNRRNFLWCSLLFATSCATAASTSPSQSTVTLPEKLRFTVTDAKGLEELQQDYELFRATLEEVLQIPIEFFPVEDYFTAASALQSNQVDLVWADPSVYVVIHAKTNALPIVTITRPDYRTVIAVRADSGIKTLADLKGKTIDMLELGSTASHLGGIKILIDAGLNPQSDFNVIMTGTYSLETLESGKADAWSRALHRYKAALEAEHASAQDYAIIAQGDLLPGDVLVLSSQLEPAAAKEIQTRILQNKDKLLHVIHSAESLASRFKGSTLVPANDSEYDPIRDAYRAIGQDDFLQ